MRISTVFGVSLVCCTWLIAHADTPLPYVVGPQVPCLHLPPNAIVMGPIICKTVVLRTDSDWTRLKQSDPDDYAIATRVMLAADRLCGSDAPRPLVVGLKPGEVACSAWVYPSNPPKRELWFKIGHTMYQLLVTIPQ